MDRVRPKYEWHEHCIRLANVLQLVADGMITRLMVFMPPRHGKSELVSRLFTAYYLYRFPERHVGLSSYSANLAYSLSRSMRENYVRGGGELGDAKAIKNWKTAGGGEAWATGVGGPATGFGWHLGVIDDPLKNAEQAASEKVREKQKDWYQSTWYTREQPEGGALVVVQTRWNEDDLSGWLLAMENEDRPECWHVVCYDAIRDDVPPELPATCTLEADWRVPGEALCPLRYGLERLKNIASRVGSYVWNALFQQRPRPKDGAFFKQQWLKIVDALPCALSRLIRYWDKAATAGEGDFTVGALIGKGEDDKYYVVDIVRGQWSPGDRETRIRQTAESDAAKYGHLVTWLEQEPGSGGKESAQSSVRNLAGFPARYETVTGDKQVRAEPFASQAEADNVRLVKAGWNQPYINELCSFPNGNHDDQVDASSGAFNKICKPEAGRVERVKGEARKRYGFV